MIDFPVRRIVIACDAVCDTAGAIETAAGLAERWGSELHGIFVEDDSLMQLAGLPFSRQVVLSRSAIEALTPAQLASECAALAARARAVMAAAAERRGVGWSFIVTRDAEGMRSLSGQDADLLVLQGVVRAFAGRFQPASRWMDLACKAAGAVLLLRPPRHDGRTVVALLNGTAGLQRTLAAAAAMADFFRLSLAVLVKPGAADASEVTARLQDLVPGSAANADVHEYPMSAKSLERELRRLRSALLVIDADPADIEPAPLEAAVAETSGDLLLVR